MARAKGGFKTRRRHKKVLKMTEGFRNSGSRSVTVKPRSVISALFGINGSTLLFATTTCRTRFSSTS